MKRLFAAFFGKKQKPIITRTQTRDKAHEWQFHVIDPVHTHASKFAKRSKLLDASKMAERSDYLYPKFNY